MVIFISAGAGMAHKSFAMPLLKLTKRPTREKKEVEYLHRGVQGPDRSTSSIIYDQVVQFSQSNDLSLQSTQCEVQFTQCEVQLPHEDLSFSTVTEREPTSYEIERKASVLGWEKVRIGLLKAIREASAMPPNQACIHCNTAASLKCKQCSPIAYYCYSCFREWHAKVNFLHIAKKWEVCFKNICDNCSIYTVATRFFFLIFRMIILCLLLVMTLK